MVGYEEYLVAALREHFMVHQQLGWTDIYWAVEERCDRGDLETCESQLSKSPGYGYWTEGIDLMIVGPMVHPVNRNLLATPALVQHASQRSKQECPIQRSLISSKYEH